jgi:hypothetical protein
VHREGGGNRHDLADQNESHAKDDRPAPIRLGTSHLKARPRAQRFSQHHSQLDRCEQARQRSRLPRRPIHPTTPYQRHQSRKEPSANARTTTQQPDPAQGPNTTHRTPSFADQRTSQQDFVVPGSERSTQMKCLGTTRKHPLKNHPQPSNALCFSCGRIRLASRSHVATTSASRIMVAQPRLALSTEPAENKGRQLQTRVVRRLRVNRCRARVALD